MTRASHIETKRQGRLYWMGLITLAGAAMVGVYLISNIASLVGYEAVLGASAIPTILWVRQSGNNTLPIWPITALGYFFYFGIAILTDQTARYSPDQVLEAGLTVALFQMAVTLGWRALAFREGPRSLQIDHELDVDFALTRLTFGALLFGLIFEVGNWEGYWSLLGSWLGTFRSLAMSATAVGCFLFGVGVGRGRIASLERYAGYALVILLALLEASTLIMHAAIVYVAAALIGYITSSKQVPWITIIFVLSMTTLFHGTESIERERHWSANASEVTLADAPALLAEWATDSVEQTQDLNQGPSASEHESLASRASQLTMLLLVEEQTPRNIPFLDGETYANFPDMVIPRFLSPQKVASQVNLHLLSIHYGLTEKEGTETTTIAWNLIPEAYANFGYPGVISAGLIFGVIIGTLTWLTSGSTPISLRGLAGLAALVTLLDVEYDFSYLMLNLLQTLFSISVFYFGIKALELLLGKKVLEAGPAGFDRVRHVRNLRQM
jgi:hypothetical protein